MPTHSSLRIAFAASGGTGWIAGVQYLENLFVALRSLPGPSPVDLVLLVPSGNGQSAESYGALRAHVSTVLSVPEATIGARLVLAIQRRLGIAVGPEPALASCLRAYGVNVLFCSGEYGSRFELPLLCWIPDFQHVRLPEMFSREELGARNRAYRRMARFSTRLIVSSDDALRDLKCFVPTQMHKARVLPFVAHLPDDAYELEPTLCARYSLPPRFVYLPNQFWKHKNHGIVIRALQLLKERQPVITVVCSGNTTDSRDPEYFARLRQTVIAAGLGDRFIILGMIPRSDVFKLMRQCLAVLQPSLFEGWSTSVEEAKSIGKRVILSDIAVHREQDPPGSVFFDANDPQALACCLVQAFAEWNSGPDPELEAAAREHLPVRLRAFGEAFLAIVREVAERG